MYSRAQVRFVGKVQGVFFRANTERKAIELGLVGWVMNFEDGSVRAIFEGPKDKIKEIIEWCSKHIPYAKVKDIELSWESYSNEFDNFEIKY
jgi:acylphosphatase